MVPWSMFFNQNRLIGRLKGTTRRIFLELVGQPMRAPVELANTVGAQQSLPTTNVSTVGSCGLCGCDDSWRQSLLECSIPRSIWGIEDKDLYEVLLNTHEPDGRRWVFSLIETLPLASSSKLWSLHGKYGIRGGRHYMSKFSRAICLHIFSSQDILPRLLFASQNLERGGMFSRRRYLQGSPHNHRELLKYEQMVQY